MIEIQYKNLEGITHTYYIHDSNVKVYMTIIKIKTPQKAILHCRSQYDYIKIHCDMVLRGFNPAKTNSMGSVEADLHRVGYLLRRRNIVSVVHLGYGLV